MSLVRIHQARRGEAQLDGPRVLQDRQRPLLDLQREHGRGPRPRLRGLRLRRPLRRHLETQTAGEEMTFPIQVDLDDAVPIYAQIEKQIRALLGSGHWKAGDKLPSVRETAVRLQVNPLTVVKAYRHLQEEGLLETRPGAGVFVAKVPQAPRAARRDAVRRSLEEAIAEAAAHGLTREEISELFDAALLKHKARLQK